MYVPLKDSGQKHRSFENIRSLCNITTCPVTSELGNEWQSGKQNTNLPCPAQQVMFWAESSQDNSPLLSKQSGGASGSAGMRQGKLTIGAVCLTQQVMFWNLCCTL